MPPTYRYTSYSTCWRQGAKRIICARARDEGGQRQACPARGLRVERLVYCLAHRNTKRLWQTVRRLSSRCSSVLVRRNGYVYLLARLPQPPTTMTRKFTHPSPGEFRSRFSPKKHALEGQRLIEGTHNVNGGLGKFLSIIFIDASLGV